MQITPSCVWNSCNAVLFWVLMREDRFYKLVLMGGHPLWNTGPKGQAVGHRAKRQRERKASKHKDTNRQADGGIYVREELRDWQCNWDRKREVNRQMAKKNARQEYNQNQWKNMHLCLSERNRHTDGWMIGFLSQKSAGKNLKQLVIKCRHLYTHALVF